MTVAGCPRSLPLETLDETRFFAKPASILMFRLLVFWSENNSARPYRARGGAKDNPDVKGFAKTSGDQEAAKETLISRGAANQPGVFQEMHFRASYDSKALHARRQFLRSEIILRMIQGVPLG